MNNFEIFKSARNHLLCAQSNLSLHSDYLHQGSQSAVVGKVVKMAQRIPIILCGKTVHIGAHVTQLLKPEFEGNDQASGR